MKRVRSCLLGMMMGFLVGPGAAFGQQCVEDVLCIITEDRSDGVAFYVDNLLDTDLIVIFDVEADNMVGSVSFPYFGTYSEKRQSPAFTLRPKKREARWRYSYSFQWRRALNMLGCKDGFFCIGVEEREAYIEVYVDNQRPFDLTIELDLDVGNAVSEVDMPYTATFPGKRRSLAYRLKRIDPLGAMQYKYAYQWLYGSLHARHDDTFDYDLPYAPGKAFTVIQGFNGAFSHQGKHAIDWDMPERTPVLAARGGIVVEVEDGYTESGLDDRLKTRANHILLQHDDGTLGNYVHLAANGAFVAVGQRVAQGQAIGVSGNTGYSSGPHLHFEVSTVTAMLTYRTIPIRFHIDGRRNVVLKEGQAY